MDQEPEYQTIEALVEYLLEEEREEYTHEELTKVANNLRMFRWQVRKALAEYGLVLAKRPHEKHVRGFNSNDSDRWYGPGSWRC